MGEFRRIACSEHISGDKRVVVVELLDEKLSGPTLVQELAQELSQLLTQIDQKNVLLKLARVEFISSAALNRLINFQKRVRDADGTLKLCDLRPSIDSVFATTRLNQVFELCRTEVEALDHY